jgi:energy-converting hydrogenase Eha subunit C
VNSGSVYIFIPLVDTINLLEAGLVQAVSLFRYLDILEDVLLMPDVQLERPYS